MPTASPLAMASPRPARIRENSKALSRPPGVGLRLPTTASGGSFSASSVPATYSASGRSRTSAASRVIRGGARHQVMVGVLEPAQLRGRCRVCARRCSRAAGRVRPRRAPRRRRRSACRASAGARSPVRASRHRARACARAAPRPSVSARTGMRRVSAKARASALRQSRVNAQICGGSAGLCPAHPPSG